MKKYIVALDQGTTSSRAVVVDASGAVVAAHGIESVSYTHLTLPTTPYV